ncbi:MAG: 3-phosphoshikimate 1-carboxyvinyltransferase [Anaerolineae bacterium]|nr:3-phosphoshikimate 1-carboxyvinyltransferase [Anaerolineae bacterium]
MKSLTVHPGKKLNGCVSLPGDKSISHRALLFGALALGETHVTNFLPGGDCMATLACLRAMGVEIETIRPTELIVRGRGLHSLQPAQGALNCVRSGTTMRLLAGILAGQRFDSLLDGEEQLRRRPMRRVIDPLQRMGAHIESQDGRAPLKICARALRGCDHQLEIASAQVKSALLLAGLFAEGITRVHEPGPSRDHTERMLQAMGAAIHSDGNTVQIEAGQALHALPLRIPGDISSAAFPLVAALLAPQSELTLKDVGVNPTRTGLLDVLQIMGAAVKIGKVHFQGSEPTADLTISSSTLRGTQVGGETVVRMIDEFPIFMVAATQAQGVTVVRDAAELRVKETDRIATAAAELQAMGARVETLPDGFIVEGATPLRGAHVSSHGDHRLAMALAVAGLIASGETVIDDIDCAEDSFPGFVNLMRTIGAQYD